MFKDIFFTSDTHFGHGNIIKYSKRPFASVEDMNEQLINNWNNTIRPSDTVYHLGDAGYPKNRAEQVQLINNLNRLNGNIIFVVGNHDNVDTIKQVKSVKEIHTLISVKITGILVTLCHYPLGVWNQSHRGSLQLHGHCHGQYPACDQQIDVGVDAWDYAPVSWSRVIERMKTLPPSSTRLLMAGFVSEAHRQIENNVASHSYTPMRG